MGLIKLRRLNLTICLASRLLRTVFLVAEKLAKVKAAVASVFAAPKYAFAQIA